MRTWRSTSCPCRGERTLRRPNGVSARLRSRPRTFRAPGYHWYKLGTLRIMPSTYVYFFWSWIIQFPVDAAVDPDHPDQEFEIWARIKFEGPGFPHGKPGETNAISVERVVLVRAAEG